MATTDGPGPVADQLGPDRVERDGEDRIVHAARAMPSWEVRRYRRVQVVFHGDRYYVAAALPTGKGCVYRLRPWTDEVIDRPSEVVRYDLEYVHRRERARRKAAGSNWVRFLLIPAQPLIGFLPWKLKARLQEALGVSPNRCTAYSVYLELALALALGAAVVVMLFAGGMSEAYPGIPSQLENLFRDTFIMMPVFLVLLLDAMCRITALLRDAVDEQVGFYEWLVRWVVRLFRRKEPEAPLR